MLKRRRRRLAISLDPDLFTVPLKNGDGFAVLRKRKRGATLIGVMIDQADISQKDLNFEDVLRDIEKDLPAELATSFERL